MNKDLKGPLPVPKTVSQASRLMLQPHKFPPKIPRNSKLLNCKTTMILNTSVYVSPVKRQTYLEKCCIC